MGPDKHGRRNWHWVTCIIEPTFFKVWGCGVVVMAPAYCLVTKRPGLTRTPNEKSSVRTPDGPSEHRLISQHLVPKIKYTCFKDSLKTFTSQKA